MYYTENKSLENIVYVNDLGIECVEEWRDIPDYVGYYQASDLGRIRSVGRFCDKKFKNGGVRRDFINSKVLSLSKDKRDYYSLTLYKDGKVQHIRVHELIAIAFLNHKKGVSRSVVVDHIDTKKKWNNSVSNLQIITQRKNSSKDKNGSSAYAGVSYKEKLIKSPYEASVRINGVQICLGVFNNGKEASEMYQLAVKNQHLFTGCKDGFKNIIGVPKRRLSEEMVLLIRRFHRIHPNFNRFALSTKLGIHSVTINKIIRRGSWKHI